MRFALLVAVLLPTSAIAQPERPESPQLPRLAKIADAKAMLAEATLPPLPFDGTPQPIPLFPYAADTMKHYGSDVSIEEILKDPEKYRYRVGVLHALEFMRKAAEDKKSPLNPKSAILITQIDGPVNNKSRKSISDTQDVVALWIAEMEIEMESLMALESLRQDEPQRWRAHHANALAELRRRLVFLNEYNKALGDVRTDSLPALPEGSTSWRLISSASVKSRADVRKLSKHASEGFQAMTTDYKGTPWALLAERGLLAQPGLMWEPIPK